MAVGIACCEGICEMAWSFLPGVEAMGLGYDRRTSDGCRIRSCLQLGRAPRLCSQADRRRPQASCPARIRGSSSDRRPGLYESARRSSRSHRGGDHAGPVRIRNRDRRAQSPRGRFAWPKSPKLADRAAVRKFFEASPFQLPRAAPSAWETRIDASRCGVPIGFRTARSLVEDRKSLQSLRVVARSGKNRFARGAIGCRW